MGLRHIRHVHKAVVGALRCRHQRGASAWAAIRSGCMQAPAPIRAAPQQPCAPSGRCPSPAAADCQGYEDARGRRRGNMPDCGHTWPQVGPSARRGPGHQQVGAVSACATTALGLWVGSCDTAPPAGASIVGRQPRPGSWRRPCRNLDPYLMLDELRLPSRAAFAGFPDHPHRWGEAGLGGVARHTCPCATSRTPAFLRKQRPPAPLHCVVTWRRA